LHSLFEDDFGGWVQSGSDDADWTRNSGTTPSSSTGPSTANEGSFYIYTEASYIFNKRMELSAWFDLRNLEDAELTFDYHMYGSNMGSLVIEASYDGKTWQSIFSGIFR